MHHLRFVTCPADPDLWMWPVQKSDGSPCYEYVLLYMDNTLVVSKRAEEILWNEIGWYFELKEESIGTPTIYLGGRVRLEQTLGSWAHNRNMK